MRDTNGSKIITPIYTGDLAKYEYWVYCEDDGGNYIYSPKITIEVIYNCRFDEIKINDLRLDRGIERPTGLSFVPRNRGNDKEPNLHLNMSTSSNGAFDFTIRDRIVNNASDYCPLIDFWIYKGIDGRSELEVSPKDYDHLVDVYAKTEGEKINAYMTLLKQNNPY